MAYMMFEEQVKSHLEFLRSQGLYVETLDWSAKFIRCAAIDDITGRKERCYITSKTILKNGLVGFSTSCRSAGGVFLSHKTYGLGDGNEELLLSENIQSNKFQPPKSCINTQERIAAEKAQCFWDLSAEYGSSDYLIRKRVGYYGIRFRDNEYGKVAVIPLRDITQTLWNYQILNADGSKRFAKDGRIKGLFHSLKELRDGYPIGIAESYATAATCLELSGIATVSAFSCTNMMSVAVILREKYTKSEIVIFGDNDRHNRINSGILAAEAVLKQLETQCVMAIPSFDGYPKSKDLTDWNDLAREMGAYEASQELRKYL